LDGGASVPPDPPRSHEFHIDTFYLIPLLLGQEPQGEERDIFERAKNLAEGGYSTRLATSMVAVGEAFTLIASEPDKFRPADRAVSASKRFEGYIAAGRLRVCWADCRRNPPIDRFTAAAEVRKRAPTAGPADHLIVACALACRGAKKLFTSDGKLVTQELNKYCRKGGRDFVITEAPPAP
jgi:hypothetical protein